MFEPTAAPVPVIVEVPHAGLRVDPESLCNLLAPAYALARDADLYVDELYADAPAAGATLLVAHMSRYVCDLNRSEQDLDPLVVESRGSRNSPHGLIWRMTTDQRPALRERLSLMELERRLDLFYRPYHRALQELIERHKQRFGAVVLLSAHSMPTAAVATGADGRRRARADVVPGSRGGTTAALEVLGVPDELAARWGWTVAHDDPYRGGFTTGHYGRPDQGCHAVQLELARRLYMDERSLGKNRDFEQVKGFCRELVVRLAGLTLHKEQQRGLEQAPSMG